MKISHMTTFSSIYKLFFIRCKCIDSFFFKLKITITISSYVCFQTFFYRDEIKEFFRRLKSPTEMESWNINPNNLSKSQILRLCTYFIEKKCNFNGEGVFIRSHSVEFDDEYSLQMEEIIKAIKR